VRTHALSPGVTLDAWNASGFPRWGPASFLALDLGSARLRALAAELGAQGPLDVRDHPRLRDPEPGGQ
jgi:hypothetical protein